VKYVQELVRVCTIVPHCVLVLCGVALLISRHLKAYLCTCVFVKVVCAAPPLGTLSELLGLHVTC